MSECQTSLYLSSEGRLEDCAEANLPMVYNLRGDSIHQYETKFSQC